MNYAHMHIILNHIPIIGVSIALGFFIHAFFTKNESALKFSLLALATLALLVLPVFLTGEPAEEVVEHIPDVTEAFIEPHEDAAKYSLVLTLLTGASAFIGFWFQGHEKWKRRMNFAVIGLATAAILSLLYTGNLGGKIRHTEIREENTLPTSDIEKGE